MKVLFSYILIILAATGLSAGKRSICNGDSKHYLKFHNKIPNFKLNENSEAGQILDDNTSGVSLEECIENCCSEKHCSSFEYRQSGRCVLFSCKLYKGCIPVRSNPLRTRNTYGILDDELADKIKMMRINKASNRKFVKNVSKNSTTPKVSLKDISTVIRKSTKSTTSATTTTTSTTKRIALTKHKSSNKKHSSFRISANAGPDKTVILNTGYLKTMDVVSLYGSAAVSKNKKLPSSKKLKFHWTKLPDSLAAGKVVNGSDNAATLSLAQLIQGKYKFQLTVTGPNGERATDKVVLTVIEKNDNVSKNLMETVLKTSIYNFTEKNKKDLIIRMKSVLEKYVDCSNSDIIIEDVSPTLTNNTQITFYALALNKINKKMEPVFSGLIESKLKKLVTQHKYILDYEVLLFQSKVCYFTCNGRGKCCPISHQCNCKFPWMTNFFKQHQTGQPNCSMHVILMILICVVILSVTFLCLFTCRRLAKRYRRRSNYGNEVLKYKLLDTDS